MQTEYTYDETLALIEKTMIESGIRDYCTNVCKGRCCAGCYTSNRLNCKTVEKGRRITCSAFICSGITSVLAKRYTHIHSIYNDFMDYLISKVREVKDQKSRKHYANPYYEVSKAWLKEIKKLTFSKSVVDKYVKRFNNSKMKELLIEAKPSY